MKLTVAIVSGTGARTGDLPTYTPKSRTDFWLKKLESNAIRDQLVKADLERSGWRVMTVWECELRESVRNAISVS